MVVRVARRYGRCGGSSCEFSSEVSQSLERNPGHINKQFRIRTDVAIRPLPTQRSTLTRLLPRHPPVHPTSHPAPEDVENVLHGMRLLREFDEESRALSVLRSELSTTAKQLFECSICMEKMPADSFARIDTCGHTFCRECLRGHVTARLEEHRFPILCPTCTANRGKGKKKAGGTCRLQMVVAVAPDSAPWLPFRGFAVASLKPRTHRRAIQNLDGNGNGLVLCSRTLQKVRLQCSSPHFLCQQWNRCQRSMFVARDEHEETNIIVCPLPDCKHAWCKQCQQSIDFGGPKHTCDGMAELDHLMKQQGWKYCPSESTSSRCHFYSILSFFFSMQDADPERIRL